MANELKGQVKTARDFLIKNKRKVTGRNIKFVLDNNLIDVQGAKERIPLEAEATKFLESKKKKVTPANIGFVIDQNLVSLPEPKGIGEKAVDLFSKTRGALRRGALEVRKELQTTPTLPTAETLVTPGKSSILPFPIAPISKGLARGIPAGFTEDDDTLGEDILKSIPEIRTGVDVSIPVVPGRQVELTPSAPPPVDPRISNAISFLKENNKNVTKDNVMFVIKTLPVTEYTEEENGTTDRVLGDNTSTFESIAKKLGAMDRSLFGVLPQAGIKAAKIALDKGVEGVKVSADKILNLPKRTTEFNLDVLTDPLTPILGGIGFTVRSVSQLPRVAAGIKRASSFMKSLPFAENFQRARGADKAFIRMLDDTDNSIAAIQEDALEITESIAKKFNKPGQSKRIAQIVRGGITNDPELRAAAESVSTINNRLFAEAQKLDLIGDTFRTKLTRKQLAALRAEGARIQAQIKVAQDPLTKTRAKLSSMVNNIKIKGDKTLAKDLNEIAFNFSLKGFKRREVFQRIFDAVEGAAKIPTRTKGKLFTLLDKAESSIGGTSFKFTKKLVDTLDDAIPDGLKISGIKPILKEIGRITKNFPGQASILRDLETKSGEITNKIVNHYTQGGRGYLPRLYSFFEDTHAKELAKRGVTLEDLTDLPEDQLNAIYDLSKTEFKAFLKKIVKKKASAGFKARKVVGERFIRRKNVSDNMRKALGEIQTVEYPFLKGASQLARDVKNARLFKNISLNKKWAITDEEAKAGISAGRDFVKMPKSKNLGALSEMNVDRKIASEINYITRTTGPLEKKWLSALGKWKAGKVLFNPATHFRNMLSNSTLLDLSGVDHLEQSYLLPKAGKELLNKGKFFQEAKSAGLLRSGFYENEIGQFLKSYDKSGDFVSNAMGFADDVTKQLGKAYNSEESIFKMAKFISEREKGIPVRAAVEEAEKWLFNYGKLSPFVRTAKNVPLGSPFLTFSAKALPRIAEVAINNPAKLYKYKAVFNAIEDNAQRKLGIDDEEMKWIKKTFRGTSLVLPTKDAEGLPMVMDLSYILPWGDIGEEGGLGPLPPAFSPGGPLMAAFEAGPFNKSLFTERPVRQPLESWYIDFADTADFVAKALLPSFTPGIKLRESPIRGGYSYDKVISAINKTKDVKGRVRSLGWTIADTVFGLKAFPVDANEQRFFNTLVNKREIAEAIRQEKKTQSHPGISEEAKARSHKRLGDKINRFIKKVK